MRSNILLTLQCKVFIFLFVLRKSGINEFSWIMRFIRLKPLDTFISFKNDYERVLRTKNVDLLFLFLEILKNKIFSL